MKLDVNSKLKIKELEKYLILTRLIQCQGNKTHAAKSLGIGIRTLQRRLDCYGIASKLKPGQSTADVKPDTIMMAEDALNQFNEVKYGE